MQNHHTPQLLLLRILPLILTIQPTTAVDFLFNGFASSSLSLHGNSSINSGILSLTADTTFSIGRSLYPSRLPAKQPNTSTVLPFSTSFIFAMAPYEGRLPGHGIVFVFVPRSGIEGTSSAQHLGLLNLTNNGDHNNHILGVEFDCFRNEEFNDVNDNHVGVDVNSLVSVSAHEAGYWHDEDSFEELELNNGRTYQVWIDYADIVLNVTMGPVGMTRPIQPLLSVALNLSDVFEDEMYVGFTASTGAMVQGHNILAWSFSNTNFSLSEGLITDGLPSFELIPTTTPVHRTRGFIAGVTAGIGVFAMVCCVAAYWFVIRSQRMRKVREEMEDWELEYWPHRISCQEIDSATKGFAEENVIGIGGNGKVYRGSLLGGSEVAVKCISHENKEGIRSFLSEISTLGRVKHRNLVGLRGWCKKDKNKLIVVYDYMENGSLDKRIFECDDTKLLSYEDRIRILKQVASGIHYLHHGWESKVLHRDIKASNVLLDREMNARLGDFGLARMHDHDVEAATTRVVGTAGYLAPEIVRNGRATTRADVFGFGVLILEVVCGRRPVEEGMEPLVDWVREAFRRGEVSTVVDRRLRDGGEVLMDGGDDEVERVLRLGVLCAHSDPNMRPTMGQVVKFFEGKMSGDEGDGMDVYLLENMRRDQEMLLDVNHRGFGAHPTFDEIRQGWDSSSMSLSWSNTVVEGR